jgi:hypothetical protein
MNVLDDYLRQQNVVPGSTWVSTDGSFVYICVGNEDPFGHENFEMLQIECSNSEVSVQPYYSFYFVGLEKRGFLVRVG